MSAPSDGDAGIALLDLAWAASSLNLERVQAWLTAPEATQQAAAPSPAPPPAALRWLALLQQSRLQALQALQARLAQRAAAGQPVARLRELYDLWVECAEQAHARLLCNPEFSRTCGELLDTWLASASSTETA
ncbi:MAG TPA: poly(R)-hydroxyalkanoic acid synthase subunit PhaE [Candidatus Competibacteraceae bacterium]|nr:poly(R)-hydroxyalkanoic acid synthase subunit PhaE [Candidatus Competibacteraceae bacterium]